eukprot:11922997-Heterocapsa_arctica.AAC.1
MALVPCAVAIDDRKVDAVAEGVDGFRPEGGRQPRLLQKNTGAFEHMPHSPLRHTVSGSPMGSACVVLTFHCPSCFNELGSAI